MDAREIVPECPPTGMAVVKKTFSTFGPYVREGMRILENYN